MSDGSACTGQVGEINLQLISQERMRSAVFKQVDTIVVRCCCSYHVHTSLSVPQRYTVSQKLCSMLTTQGDKSKCSATLNLHGLMLVSGTVPSTSLPLSLCVTVCVSLYFLLEYQHASYTSKRRTF